MEGKFLNIEVNSTSLKHKEIKEEECTNIDKPKLKINIPEIKTTYELLPSKEYDPNLVGPKAYNLRRMEEMKETGKLKDITIPKSFAIPCGIYDRVLEANAETTHKINENIAQLNEISNPKKTSEILTIIQCLIGCPSFLKDKYKDIDIPEKIQQEILKFKQ